MANIAKISLVFQDSNRSRGGASESWYIPYSSDAGVSASAKAIAQGRAPCLGYNVSIFAVRSTVYSVGTTLDPTALVRVKTLPTDTTGYATTSWAGNAPPNYFANAEIHSVGYPIFVSYADGRTTRAKMFGAPFVMSWDFNSNVGAANYPAALNTISTQFGTRLAAYSGVLVGAAVFRRLLVVANKQPITNVTVTNDNACVQVAGSDLTSLFPPGTRVKIGGRVPNKSQNYLKHDPLNGSHVVLSSAYDGAAHLNTICLSCSRYPFVDGQCLASQGFIGQLQHIQQALLPLTQGQALTRSGSFGAPRRGRTRGA